MLDEVTHHMLPHLPEVPHLHVNRPLDSKTSKLSITGEPEQPDDDGSKNLKKQTLILSAKQQPCTCIALFGMFLSRPLYDQDVKLPNATFYGGREHYGFSFLFFKINTALKNSTAEKFADIWQNERG